MKEQDEIELRAFFKEMKAKDRELPLPEFPLTTGTRQISWWIAGGIAASLCLGSFFLQEKEKTVNHPGELLIITLEQGENQELQFGIRQTTEMDIWDSPTASLLTEF